MGQRGTQVRYRTNGRPLSTRRRVQPKKSMMNRIFHKTEKNKYIITGVLALGMAAVVTNGVHRGATNLGIEPTMAIQSSGNTLTEEEKWRESLRVDVTNQTKQNTENKLDVLENLVEQYNENAQEYGKQQITKNAILICSEPSINDGQIYTDYTEDGTLEYHQNYNAQTDQWVEGKNIDGAYVLINSLDRKAIAGIVKINDEYEPLKVDLMMLGNGEEIYASENYVTLDGEKEVYENIAEESQKREQAQQEDEMEY